MSQAPVEPVASKAPLVAVAQPLDLRTTLDSGQVFRWRWEGEWAWGVVGRRAFGLCAVDGGLRVVSSAPADEAQKIVGDYLRLGDDLDALYSDAAADAVLSEAMARYRGLRLLRQDPWECLFSFICSSTSNIPRIKLNVGAVAGRLGYSIGPETHDVTFPEPETVVEAGEQLLRDLGLGFRAKYLVPAAEAVASGQLKLSDLREASYTDARNALMELHGVGEKIADCVLAFSLDKPESFIVDRHILRALHRWYDVPEKASLSYAADWARDYFGEHAALANQYMFRRERLARRAADWGGAHTDRALPEDGR